MQRKIIVMIAFIISACLLVSPYIAFAGCGSDSKELAIPKKLLGVIKTVDEKNNSINVRSDVSYDPFIIKIDEKTIIKKDNENKTFKDIRAGERVRIRYIETENGLVAKTIVLNPETEGNKK